MPKGHAIRFPVDPRDVPPEKAARRMHLTPAEFHAMLPALIARGFPVPDPTTGMFDLKAIDCWMDERSGLTAKASKRDASSVVDQRLERTRWGA